MTKPDIRSICAAAKRATFELASLSEKRKDKILRAMAEGIDQNRQVILEANGIDLELADRDGISGALRDRLCLNESRLDAMLSEIEEVVALPDPVGIVLEERLLESGIRLKKITVPVGVVAMIYEARPNVTSDASVLCVKAGNAVVLRGGKEALRTNIAIAEVLQNAGEAHGLPRAAIQLISSTDRECVRELVQCTESVDLVIPRGGESLIRAVADSARVAVIKHYKGLCHIYVDSSANLERAIEICENAKCQRPGVCNAVETILVHQEIADQFLPLLCQRLAQCGVEIRGDRQVCLAYPAANIATSEDWRTEYLDLIVSIKVVGGVFEAINHINEFGSHHSDAILSEDKENQELFVQQVDSAAVYVNASTRFTDGSQYGMGSEIGISTDKLHARGPMGARELTTYKWVGWGNGQIRS
ncbi:MAG: glutamate-5-semialdehyde dehydrogenase [Bdellovibrionales bacterium]|nr:glutamate-5-semialdehyde dehydrogenase [Bdellovibrionales bacterium]